MPETPKTVSESITVLVAAHGLDVVMASLPEDANVLSGTAAEELQTIINDLKQQLETSKSALVSAQEEIEKMTANITEKETIATVSAQITSAGLEPTDKMISAMQKLDEAEAAEYLQHMASIKSRVTELVAKLTVATSDATSNAADGVESITNFDQALAYVQKRDKIDDVDDTINVAKAEFPALYKSYVSM